MFCRSLASDTPFSSSSSNAVPRSPLEARRPGLPEALPPNAVAGPSKPSLVAVKIRKAPSGIPAPYCSSRKSKRLAKQEDDDDLSMTFEAMSDGDGEGAAQAKRAAPKKKEGTTARPKATKLRFTRYSVLSVGMFLSTGALLCSVPRLMALHTALDFNGADNYDLVPEGLYRCEFLSCDTIMAYSEAVVYAHINHIHDKAISQHDNMCISHTAGLEGESSCLTAMGKQAFKRHIVAQHAGLEFEPCPVCLGGFARRDAFNRHRDGGCRVCPFCQERLTSAALKKEHLVTCLEGRIDPQEPLTRRQQHQASRDWCCGGAEGEVTRLWYDGTQRLDY